MGEIQEREDREWSPCGSELAWWEGKREDAETVPGCGAGSRRWCSARGLFRRTVLAGGGAGRGQRGGEELRYPEEAARVKWGVWGGPPCRPQD